MFNLNHLLNHETNHMKIFPDMQITYEFILSDLNNSAKDTLMLRLKTSTINTSYIKYQFSLSICRSRNSYE